jgi:hypothetical protein
LLLILMPGGAWAQFQDYPRLGLSAAPDAYVDSLTVQPDQEFTLYLVATGPNGTEPLPFGISSLQWAVFAGCCGVIFDIHEVTYNPQLDHVGHPLAGVVSTAPDCLDVDFLLLATLDFQIINAVPGTYLMPAGATGPAWDCAAESHLFLDLTVSVRLEEGGVVSTVPNDSSDGSSPASGPQTWGGVKANYR